MLLAYFQTMAGKKSPIELKRISIMISKANQEKLREAQAKIIASKRQSTSFSQVLNLALDHALNNGFKAVQ